jgi:hypothetical protein
MIMTDPLLAQERAIQGMIQDRDNQIASLNKDIVNLKLLAKEQKAKYIFAIERLENVISDGLRWNY